MKRSALQCVAGIVGASLVIAGVVWTCRQLTSPTQLNAAQNSVAPLETTATSDGAKSARALSTKNARANATPIAQNGRIPGVKATTGKQPIAKAASDDAKRRAAAKGSNAPDAAKKIRSASATSKLNLSLVDANESAAAAEQGTSSLRFLDENDAEASGDDRNASISPLQDAPFPADNLANDPFPSLEFSPNAPQDASFPEAPFNDSTIDDQLFDETNAHAQTANANIDENQALADDSEPDVPTPRGATSLEFIDSNADAASQSVPEPTKSPLFNDAKENESALVPLQEAPAPLAAPRTIEKRAADLTANADVVSTPIPNASQFPSNASDVDSDPSVSRAAKYLAESVPFLNTPGDEDLNGPQSLQLVVEKIAPTEAPANKPTTVVVKVKNQGTKTLKNLLLHDVLPANTQFVSSEPEIAPTSQGDLYWTNFDLEPQREKKFEYVVVPLQEGDFGSVATVIAPIAATNRTKCSRPELKIAVAAPERVELGQNVNFEIVVSNVGSGAATNVALVETIPEGLFHPSGETLNNVLGTIKAGESKRLPLTLKAVAQGRCVNSLAVAADDCEEQEVETTVDVAAPKVELDVAGPSNLYLERTATYSMTIKNVGDAAARNVKLVAQLPDSVAFVKTNNLGAYKEDERSVYWDLAELPADTEAVVELAIQSKKAANAELIFGASGPNDLSVQTSKAISIDGLAALSFSVSSSADLVETGKEFAYTVQIVNNGTKASSNVVLQVLAPDAVAILATDGPTEAKNYEGVVVFDKIPEIPPKSTVSFNLKATAKESGDCRIGFQLSSDDLEPLVKEVNTRVFQ